MQAVNFGVRQLCELHKSSVFEKCKLADRLSTRHGSVVHVKGELTVVPNRLSSLHNSIACFLCKSAMTSGVDAVEQAGTLCSA